MDERRPPLSGQERKRRRALDVAFGTYAAIALLALTWPGLAWVEHALPLLTFGLPASLVWTTAWVLGTFLVFALYHRVRP